jgi:DNA-binding CsgD family transcriptional regulator
LAEFAAGQWSSASATATEALLLARSIGQDALTTMPLAELASHAAHRGDDDYDDLLRQLADVYSAQTSAGILSLLVEDTRNWAQACRDALAGQHAAALHHLELMSQPPLMRLAAYDRLETANRAGRPDVAAGWLAELELFADEVGSPRARAVVAHGRAVASEKEAAEAYYREALEHQADAGRPFETARTHLAYGEFLRRARRRVDAREQLRAALETFEDVGAQPWAERARQELRASGESARKRDESTTTDLTAQERQVAGYVAQGLSNKEVAAQLFLSPRTIDFHLRNVFAKTGVSSRGELTRLALD